MPTVRNYSALVSELNKRTTVAVKNACDRLLGKLQELIMSEYYEAYDTEYNRTMEFYRSATTEMLSNSCGKIFMDDSFGEYPFSGYGWKWTMKQNIEEGNKGIHGGWADSESLSHHYWDSFVEYADKNAIRILKEELRNQGLNVK
jgi:hypothetical protein